MNSLIEMSEQYQQRFEEYLSTNKVINQIKPEKFIQVMKTHRGMVDLRYIDDDSAVDLRNPVIVVIGDSVSGAHFEMIDAENFITVQNLSDGYVDKLLHMLNERFIITSASIINSGIAGDNVHGMNKRLERDVLNYQPDLVIINATLNWSINRGSLKKYEEDLDKMIQRILGKTDAEIIILTPNMAVPSDKDRNLKNRVEVVRNMSKKYELPLVDIYKMWEDVLENEKDLPDLLSNRENHPTPLGHTYMARAIMQLFE